MKNWARKWYLMNHELHRMLCLAASTFSPWALYSVRREIGLSDPTLTVCQMWVTRTATSPWDLWPDASPPCTLRQRRQRQQPKPPRQLPEAQQQQGTTRITLVADITIRHHPTPATVFRHKSQTRSSSRFRNNMKVRNWDINENFNWLPTTCHTIVVSRIRQTNCHKQSETACQRSIMYTLFLYDRTSQFWD